MRSAIRSLGEWGVEYQGVRGTSERDEVFCKEMPDMTSFSLRGTECHLCINTLCKFSTALDILQIEYFLTLPGLNLLRIDKLRLVFACLQSDCLVVTRNKYICHIKSSRN